jgi:hypothetical protein
MYNNVSLYRRSFASELGSKNLSQAWLTIGIFTLAIVYCILYLGHWSAVRDWVNIVDKKNWGFFGIYSLVLWTTVLVLVPAVVFFLGYAGARLSGTVKSLKEIFRANTATLLPLSMFLWIAFVIPMLFVNITFIEQSASDPFGWGWDFFGTANIPWKQFVPRLIPWLQSVFVLTGASLSLRNLARTWEKNASTPSDKFMFILPMALFITGTAFAMLLFFTN